MTGTTRQRNTRNLPRGYFGDAQDHNFASPRTDNAVHGTGVPGAAADTGRAIASPAGDTLRPCPAGAGAGSDQADEGSSPFSGRHTSSVGLDTTEALGVIRVTACGGPSSPQGCPERDQQLHAARIISGRTTE